MALSQEARKALEIACPQKREGVIDGAEIADKIDELDGRVAAAVADLGQTISGTYDQAEVQAISDKVDELLAAMRTAGQLAE